MGRSGAFFMLRSSASREFSLSHGNGKIEGDTEVPSFGIGVSIRSPRTWFSIHFVSRSFSREDEDSPDCWASSRCWGQSTPKRSPHVPPNKRERDEAQRLYSIMDGAIFPVATLAPPNKRGERKTERPAPAERTLFCVRSNVVPAFIASYIAFALGPGGSKDRSAVQTLLFHLFPAQEQFGAPTAYAAGGDREFQAL